MPGPRLVLSSLSEVSATRFCRGQPQRSLRDEVAVEEPLEIRVDGETLAITMRTPGHDAELAAGLLLGEGVIGSAADLGRIAHCGRPGDDGHGNVLDVGSAPGSVLDIERARRGTLTGSACGVCGRRTIDDLIARIRPLDDTARVAAGALVGLADRLRDAQPAFARSGGVHAAALATLDGEYRVVREDVGRHNAVDKVLGRALLDDALPCSDRVLVVSGRTSFEIVQKGLAAGVPAIVGISAPSSLAVATAERAGLLLVGFCRGEAFTVYAGRGRISTTT